MNHEGTKITEAFTKKIFKSEDILLKPTVETSCGSWEAAHFQTQRRPSWILGALGVLVVQTDQAFSDGIGIGNGIGFALTADRKGAR